VTSKLIDLCLFLMSVHPVVFPTASKPFFIHEDSNDMQKAAAEMAIASPGVDDFLPFVWADQP
jgi:hypothetical protein